jgi:hypothetical protein
MTTTMTVSTNDKPYAPFMTDEMLARLNEHAKSSEILGGGGPSEHFSKLGLGDLDLMLTNRSGYARADELAYAFDMANDIEVEPRVAVAQRLKACLFVLGDSRAVTSSRLTSDTVSRAQRQLNELLLAYPVLMHPRLHVHVYADGKPGTCSVPHAIALAKRGRFPMEGDPGVTRARLKQWMQNVSVYLGFKTVAIPVNGLTTTAAQGSRPIEAAVKQSRAMHWTLASVDQLFELCSMEPEERNGFADYLLPADYRGKWSGAGIEAYTSSFFGACGVIDGVPCPAFFGALKRVRYGENKDLRESVVNNAVVYILGEPGTEVAGDITSRFGAIVKGMVECNFAPGPVEASQMLWGSIADRSTRQVAVAEALEVIRSARAAGAVVTVREEAFGTAAKAEPWAHALEVHNTALAMNRVIDQVAPSSSTATAAARRRHGL